MCICRCDSSPCVSIATSASSLAARHAQPVGAGPGHGFGVFWSRPHLRAARGASTGAGRRRTGPTTSRRRSGNSSSSPAIAGICTSISSGRSQGTRPFESSLIGASWSGGCVPDPMTLNGARATGARPVRSTGSCARLAGPSCRRLSRRPIEARPAHSVRGSSGRVDPRGPARTAPARRPPPTSTSASRRRCLGWACPQRSERAGTRARRHPATCRRGPGGPPYHPPPGRA